MEVRLLQAVRGSGKGRSASQAVPGNRRGGDRRGQGGTFDGREGGGETCLPLAHPRAERGRPSPVDPGRKGERFPLRGSRPAPEVRDVRDGEVAGGEGGAAPRPYNAGARTRGLRSRLRTRETALLSQGADDQGPPRGLRHGTAPGIRDD